MSCTVATSCTVIPLGDRILVKRMPDETRTPGGLVIPDTAQGKSNKGTVSAVGPGKILDNGKLSDMPVKVGDAILFNSYSGTEVTMGGEKYLIMSANDILATINED
jgi:chaperonin GroES